MNIKLESSIVLVGSPTRGATVSFTAVWPNAVHTPVIQVRSFDAEGNLIYGRGGNVSDSFPLDGPPGTYRAELLSIVWKHGQEITTVIASTTFTVA